MDEEEEKRRAKIMAEYLAGGDNDAEEDEVEFQEDIEEDEDEGTASAAVVDNYPVLRGRLKLQESHLVYLGTWCMKNELPAAAQQQQQQPHYYYYDDPTEGRKKMKTKFKLKSNRPAFEKLDLSNLPKSSPIVVPMSGYFLAASTDKIDPQRKIRETDVEIRFASKRRQPNLYAVEGTGRNEFGYFAIHGVYSTEPNNRERHLLQCDKRYDGGTGAGAAAQDDDDDEISGDEKDQKADVGELTELQDDANMSIEELRKKYYGGGGGGGPPAAKKAKFNDDEDDDDACGF